MKKLSLLFLWTLSMSCTRPMMHQGFDGALDPEKFVDKLNSHEVALAKAIYHNDVEQATAIAHEASTRKAIDLGKYIDLRRCNRNNRFSFLLFATFQDCPAIVELILDHTWGESDTPGIAFIDQRSIGSQRTALHMAAERDYEEVVAILLDKGAAVEATTREGETPLHLAAEKNFVSLVKLLVGKGAAVEATTRKGQTPLHLAAVNNSQEAVSCLLSHQAKPQAPDAQGQTPWDLARSVHHEQIVTILAMRQALAGLSYFDSIKHPLEQAHYRANKPVNAQGPNLLYHAVQEGWEEVVKILVEHEEENALQEALDQNDYKLSPLYIAVEKGNTEIVKLLVYGSAAHKHRRGANQAEAIEQEAVNDRVAAVRDLRAQAGSTLLHVAATKGYARIVRLLVEFMAIAAEQFESSQATPLYQGHVMRELAYVSQVDAYGRTAEELAREAGFTSIAIFLKQVSEAIEEGRKNLDEAAHVLSGHGGGVTVGVPGGSAALQYSKAYQTPDWIHKRAGLITATRNKWRDQNNRLWQNLSGNDAAAPVSLDDESTNRQQSGRERRCCCPLQ